MVEQEAHIFNRRSNKFRSFPGTLKEPNPTNGCKLSIANLKLPSMQPIKSTRHVPYHHHKVIQKTMQNLKTNEALYKGTVKLHIQDFKELTSHSKQRSEIIRLTENPSSDVKLKSKNHSKSVHFEGCAVPIENKVDSTCYNHHLRRSKSIKTIWNKFEMALNDQYESISKDRMSVELCIKNKKQGIH